MNIGQLQSIWKKVWDLYLSFRLFVAQISQSVIGLIGKFVHRAITFSLISIGFSAGYFFVYLKEDPKVLVKQAQSLATDMKLESYAEKAKKIGKKTTEAAQITQMRDNMERFRLMLESYQVEGGAQYPEDVLALYKEAKRGDFWNLQRNPFRGYTNDLSLLAGNYNDYMRSWAPRSYRGLVLYQQRGPNAYRIYACGDDGELLKGSQGVFYLGND